MTTYEQARADHEYLWSLSEAYDMSGGYVDQDDLKSLLRTPTKAMARKCYERQIWYWFDAGPDECETDWRNDSRVREIAERHNCEELL